MVEQVKQTRFVVSYLDPGKAGFQMLIVQNNLQRMSQCAISVQAALHHQAKHHCSANVHGDALLARPFVQINSIQIGIHTRRVTD